MTIAAAHTDRLYAKPREHTLHPLPEHTYECAWCAAFGYHYPASGEVFTYWTCIHRTGHVWVYEGTKQTEVHGTGVRVFRSGGDPDPAGEARPEAVDETDLAADAVAALRALSPRGRRSVITAVLGGETGLPAGAVRDLLAPAWPECEETAVPAEAEGSAGLEATYLRAGDSWDGALQPVTWDPLTLKFRPVAWQCGHGHPDGTSARECAQAELRRRRGVTDPDLVLSEITTILAAGVPGTPLAAFGVLFGELDRSLHQWGRFPRRWVSGRWRLDGQRRWKLSREPGSGPENLRVILEFGPEGAEGVPCLLVPDGESAVGTAEALNRVYELGREESWDERA